LQEVVEVTVEVVLEAEVVEGHKVEVVEVAVA
jgi:hypothetical protein